MKSKFSREEIIAINGRKTLQQIVIDQSDLFPHSVAPTNTEETNQVKNVSSPPLSTTQTDNNSNKETYNPALTRQAVKPSAPKILRIAKNIISELIELNETGTIQKQNFSSNSAGSSHQNTILYSSKSDITENISHKPDSELKKKTPGTYSENGNSYIPIDILKRSFGNSKFFTGSPDQT